MKHKVIIRRCDHYDPQAIRAIVAQGLAELGVEPKGKILVKPNVVLAEPRIFPHAFTRAEFLEGVLLALGDRGVNLGQVAVGERSGITVPTRFCIKNAGYLPALERLGVAMRYFDEEPVVARRLAHAGALREETFFPQAVAEADFIVNLPKFKAHPWTRLTLSLKNYIGIQDDRHRLLDHNTFLEHKIVDLNQAYGQGFIAIDAITAGQKMMLTPTPFHLGAVVMGVNPCAVDTVGCHMVNVDPADLIHLRMASERGLGPMDLAEIAVTGDFPLAEVQARTKDFQFCLERVDDYFAGTPLRATVGEFPEGHSRDYCWGGCPGALQEAVHIIKGFYPDALEKMGKVRYVVGRVEGPLDLEPGEKVLFAGACTSWRGQINGQNVDIRPTYRPPAATDARHTRSNDMLLKTTQALGNCLAHARRGWLAAPSCPVSVADHVNYLAALGGVKNPNFDPRLVVPMTLAYAQMRFMRRKNRLK
ncbi:MAG: DUF362 domain-containing protein [Deltaproteobacteria bacterium]|nr:DUF362 domain-containing protein [Deltaproteobacteria bacterium]